MRILRSKGQSFTAFNETEQALRRGLKPTDVDAARAWCNSSQRIDPDKIPAYLKGDPDLVLRQIVSVLDKVIRKPRALRDCQIETYIDRTSLAKELWVRTVELFSTRLGEDLDENALRLLKAGWQWKIHPYARFPVDEERPREDKNADYIRKYGDRTRSSADRIGRWHGALWKAHAGGTPDYSATADAIIDHLFADELKINGKRRFERRPIDLVERHDESRSEKKPVGFVEKRGESIRNSAADINLPAGPGEIAAFEASDEIVDRYFYSDIAASIAAYVTDRVKSHGARRQNSAPSIRAADFGRLIYDHFGGVPNHKQFDSETRKQIFDFNNLIRQYYAKLAKTERFRRAVAEADLEKLSHLLPADQNSLLKRIYGKERNADFTSLIRFGKLIAHAADIAEDVNLQEQFEKRIAYLATSDGQSEIRRNESFTRAWRASVAFSLRTMEGWVGAGGNDKAREKDITEASVKKELARNAASSAFEKNAAIIFGNKVIGGHSRASIFMRSSPDEIAWAWLQLVAAIRNRTNHFNTKQRLVSLLDKGILVDLNGVNKPIDARSNEQVASIGLAAFAELLAFDKQLLVNSTVDEFNRLRATSFARDEQIDDLLRRVIRTPESGPMITPKFTAVLRKAQGIFESDRENAPEWARLLGSLDLTAQSLAPQDANQFKIGILRRLYSTDFETWLSDQAGSAEIVKRAVSEIANDKRRRSNAVSEAENRVYAIAESADNFEQLQGVADLNELFARLIAEAIVQDAGRKSYKPRPEEQAERSSWLDDFRRDLFVYLLDAYIRDQKLDWIFAADDRAGNDAPVISYDRVRRDEGDGCQPWHSQFYAWLYLVPVDEAALLRNQFRRASVLEKKGGEKETAILRDIDRLMTLYLSVASAGFDGTEHIQKDAATGATQSFLIDKSLLYEDITLFDKVYSTSADTHEVSLPGTRRGLRQIVKMGHTEALRKVFEKHRITPQEVDSLASLKINAAFKNAQTRVDMRNEIIELSNARTPDIPALKKKCAEYEALAVKATLHNFSAAGARLTEHSSLHQLMMRVISRLTDFTLIWERDRNYVLLALIYYKLVSPDESPRNATIARRGGRVGFTLPEALRKRFQQCYAGMSEDQLRKLPRQIRLTESELGEGFLPVWDDQIGYCLTGYDPHLALLHTSEREEFARYFDKAQENEKDIAERDRLRAEKKQIPPRQQGQGSFVDGKRKIRNDFAHFNVIRKRVNLTYLTNAVRSLMSYDRKLKNAVAKAVADIVVEEGIDIGWKMQGDRLRHPVVIPRLELNLRAARRHDGFDPTFVLPLASVRFTSMVKAIFDFESGGYRDWITIGGETKQRGPLRYPEELRHHLDRIQRRMPAAALDREFTSILVQK